MNYRTICMDCAHIDEDPREDGRPTCAAFPGGIPDDLLYGGFDHRQPHPDDGGIMFTPDGPVDVDLLDRITAPLEIDRGVEDE